MNTLHNIQYDDAPIIVSPSTTIGEALTLIIQGSQQNSRPSSHIKKNYLLIAQQQELLGILTERDFVRISCAGIDINQSLVSSVMSQNLITIHPKDLNEPIAVLTRFRSAKVRHIPIVETNGTLVGVITHEHIRQSLKSSDLLRIKTVDEMMTSTVYSARRSASVQELTQTMSQHHVSCIVICDLDAEQKQIPAGIITEYDIVRLLNQKVDLYSLKCEDVMSSPLYLLSPQESIWSAHQQMKALGVRRLVVAEQNSLQGILTQSNILYSLDPTEVQSTISLLKQEVDRLETERVEYLKERATYLESQVASAEQKFQAIFNQTFQMIGLLKPDGTLIEANQTALSFGNFQRQDVVGEKFWNAPWWNYSEDVQQGLKEAIAQAAQGKFIRYEVDVYDGKAQLLTIDFSLRPIADENGKISFIIPEGRDISDRKKIEQDLYRQNQYEQLIASISTRFISLQESNLQQDFQNVVEALGQFFNVETSFLFQLQSENAFSMTYEWVQEGFHRQQDQAQMLPKDSFPWCLKQLEGKHIITLSSLTEDHSLERQEDIKNFRRFGIEALLVVPIHIKNKLIAWFGFGQFSKSDSWLAVQNHQLTMIGEIFGNVLERLNTESQLKHHQLHLEDLVKQRTAALSESEERFRIMADNSPVLIWVAETDKRFTYFNQPWIDFTGRTLEQEMGQGWMENIHPEDLDRYFNIYNFAFDARTSFSMEYRLKRHDGSYRWMLDQGVPRFQEDQTFCGYVGSCVDVTERIETEQALFESEERFQLALTGSADGLFDWNLENDDIYFSPRFKHILGYQDEELPNTVQNWKSHLYLSDREIVLQALEDHLKDRQPFNIEHRMYTYKGQLRWVQTRGTAVREAGVPTRLVGSIRDVSHRKKMEMDLFREKELAQVTLHSIGDAVITTDADGRIEYFNPVAETLTGWDIDNVLGQSVSRVFNLIHETTRAPIEIPIFEALQTGQITNLEENAVLISLNGREYNIEDSAAPIRNSQGDILGAVMVFHDVTGSRKLSKKLSWQASHDALTQLINRREFESRLHQEMSQMETESSHVLCFLDLDRFKIVNDSCGHLAGDDLLRQVSKLILNNVRTSDLLARIGGDEFGILLKDCDIDDASTITEKILDVVQSYRFAWKNQLFTIGVSIGLVHITPSDLSIQDVLSAADAACYAAKERGRHRIHIYTSNDQQLNQQRKERQWSLRIRQALEEDRFQLFYQQIVPTRDKPDHEDSHAEILVRMVSPQGKLIMPGTFLSSAERYDLMPMIDRWVIRNGLEKISQIQQLPTGQDQYPQTWMINLSGASIDDETFLTFLLKQIKESQVLPHTLGFEITETAAIANLNQASHLIKTLQNIGCRFALDDFGSGMSSFGYLKSLSVNYLKIDGQFIRNIHNDAPIKAMVEAINHVGHVMNIQTIAEWVETPTQKTLLAEVGVDYMQGFSIHKPHPLDLKIAS